MVYNVLLLSSWAGLLYSVRMYSQVINAEQRSSKHWELTGEGCEIAEHGSHEARVFNAIPDEGMPQSQLMVSSGRRIHETPLIYVGHIHNTHKYFINHGAAK